MARQNADVRHCVNGSTIVRSLSIVLGVASVVAGLFLSELLATLGVNTPRLNELRVVCVVGVPILLLMSFMYLNRQPARDSLSVGLQCAAQTAVFALPYFWIGNHARW